MLDGAPSLETLELTGCEMLSEYFIETMFKSYQNLKFVDLNLIPCMNLAFFETLKAHRPDILERRFKQSDIEVKDNMLRVPWKVKEKEAKKKKKKGGKKKK